MVHGIVRIIILSIYTALLNVQMYYLVIVLTTT